METRRTQRTQRTRRTRRAWRVRRAWRIWRKRRNGRDYPAVVFSVLAVMAVIVIVQGFLSIRQSQKVKDDLLSTVGPETNLASGVTPGTGGDSASTSVPGTDADRGSTAAPGSEADKGSTSVPGSEADKGSTSVPGSEADKGSTSAPGTDAGMDSRPGQAPAGSSSEAEDIIAAFAREHGLQRSEWPDELSELLETNPDTKDFVLNYPLKKGTLPSIDLSGHENSDTVPLFFQWDERWGYSMYGNNVMGLTGCGPTCLSMVCVYLLNDASYHPRYIADFSEDNGYCVPGSGSAWTLISKGGKKLGLDVIEIPLDENRIIRNLEVGNPIICVMGPGDFTTTGHFIVMTGYIDGKIKVNDPNSKIRSEKLWEYEEIKSQIRNLWVCRK